MSKHSYLLEKLEALSSSKEPKTIIEIFASFEEASKARFSLYRGKAKEFKFVQVKNVLFILFVPGKTTKKEKSLEEKIREMES